MGTDIHLHIEVKLDGQWHHYAKPSVTRFPALFAKMAGVNNHNWKFGPIVEPRGLPLDVTRVTLVDSRHYKGDGHHHSWLTLDEIREVEQFLRDGHMSEVEIYDVWGTFLFGNSITSFGLYEVGAFPKELQDVRFVFFFDN